MICFSVFFFLLHSSALYEAASYREGIIITTHTLWGSHFPSLCCTHKVWRYLLTLWTLRSLVYCKQNEQKDSLCAADAFLKKAPCCALDPPFIALASKETTPTFSWWRHRRGKMRQKPRLGCKRCGVCVCVYAPREKQIWLIVRVLQRVCNATLCCFDPLRVGCESHAPPVVRRHVCLLLHQWGSDGLMRATDRGTESRLERHRQRRLARLGFKMDAQNEGVTACHRFSVSAQHVQSEWFVSLSAKNV